MPFVQADRLRASDAVRQRDGERLSDIFDLRLRAVSPPLAAAMPARAVAIVCAAVIEVAEGTSGGPSLAAFDALRQDARSLPRHDAAIGIALMAALKDLLGPDFDEATRSTWADGYVRMVETVMAGRRNRMDLVA